MHGKFPPTQRFAKECSELHIEVVIIVIFNGNIMRHSFVILFKKIQKVKIKKPLKIQKLQTRYKFLEFIKLSIFENTH